MAAVLLLRSAPKQSLRALTADRVRDYFPSAQSLSEPDEAGQQTVRSASGEVLGRVTQTLPESAGIIGYSGPTNTLIASDSTGRVLGIRILHSDDTPEHVAEVVSTRKYFAQFKDLRFGQAMNSAHLDAVSGATLTSAAITDGVLARLGQKATPGFSSRFPDAITLEEVKQLEPKAVALRPYTFKPQCLEVLDANNKRIAVAMRTAPVSDGTVGYKGPSDTLMLLDASGEEVRGIRLRRSFDTQRYVGYVTGDSYFMNLFNGMSVSKLATLDFEAAKIEGVSGATETSWSMAEGMKKRADALLADSHDFMQDNYPRIGLANKARRMMRWADACLTSMRWRWQDTGHVLVLASALAMAFTRLRGRAWLRHLHHLGLVVYMGFMAGEMLSQSLLAGWAQHGTPWRSALGLVLLGIVALLAPVFTRRQLYCHHLCPHGAAQQLLARRLKWQWQVPAKLSHWLEFLPFALLALVVATSAWAWHLNLNAIEPFDAYSVRVAGTATLAIAVLGLALSVFVPMAYCRYGCPTGAVFKLLRFAGDNDRLGAKDWATAVFLAGVFLARGLMR